MRAIPLALALLILTPQGAQAQDRTAEERQTLVSLVRVMGESQGLRQACLGPYDRYWRGRLDQLIDTEWPEPDFESRLKQGFDSALQSARRAFPDCSPQSRSAESEAAARGRALAGRLAAVKRRLPGWRMQFEDTATMAGIFAPR